MSLSAKKWIIGLCIGACIAVGAFWWAYPRYFSPTAKLAHRLKVDPIDLAFLNSVGEKQANGIKPAAAEINQVRALMSSSDAVTRQKALLAYDYACRKGEISMDFEVFRSKLNDPDWGVRMLALDCLRLLRDPQAPALAQKMLSDPNPHVRRIAQGTIKQSSKLSAPSQASNTR